MDKNKEQEEAKVFYRVVKAPRGHPCAGLYAVEEVYIKDNTIYKSILVHEWDLRILSEAALARFGGAAAYNAYKENHNIVYATPPIGEEVKARTERDLKDLTPRKLANELKLKEPK